MNTDNQYEHHPYDTEQPVVERRLYTCCPEAGCSAFRDGLAFLHSFGIEPEIAIDDEGNHYFGFSTPSYWELDERRRFNDSIAQKVSAEDEPCDHCGNVMYQKAAWATCKCCGERHLVCEECLLSGHDLCDCDE